MKTLDVNIAVGLDYISAWILHICYLELSCPLTMFFVCYFLMSWRVARVMPVFKNKGSITDTSFYHPVSIIPTLALFECVVGSHIYNFIAPFMPQKSIWVCERHRCSGLWYIYSFHCNSSSELSAGISYCVSGY